MKTRPLLFLAVLGYLSPASGRAQEIFLQSDWLNSVASPAAAASIWAGGNESSGTTYDSPHSANGICLAESAIGQITAQTAGYLGAGADLLASGNSARAAANIYRSGSIPAVAWNVVFPGGFNPTTGQTYSPGCATNYFPSDIAQADYYLRARLEVNPADGDAAQQLVLLVEDQMLPLEWAGGMALAYATYARIAGLTPNGTNPETIAVEDARGYFQGACAMFAQFLANPFNASLVEGQNPCVSDAVTNQVAQILDDYLRDLAQYAEASLKDFQIRDLASFYDPTVAGSAPPQALLNDIDNTVNEIQMRLLLATPFTNLPAYTISAAGQVQSRLHDLGRLHQSVVLGRITFNSGASGDPTGNDSLNYGEFTTAFVPFFTGLQNPGNSSFDVALGLASNFVNYAVSQESFASNHVFAVLQRQYEWTSAQQNLQNQYESQLKNLCGYMLDTNGKPAPDIFFAALPPGTRESIAAQVLGTNVNYHLDQTGTIYQQWQALQTAETSLSLAYLNLSNTFATILVRQQVANAIYSYQVRLAEMILTNGQQIAAIDQQQGEVQAQADLANAQIQATAAQQEASDSIWGKLLSLGEGLTNIVDTISKYFTLGASSVVAKASGGILTAGGPTLNWLQSTCNNNDEAAADLQTGQVQANAALQIANLNAQIAHINASEQAQAEFVQADTTMLNLSADLASLQQQANSQEVQIQLAAQQVDQERNKLANMISQVSYLMQQWLRSAALVNQNPDFTSDLLLTRDATIQGADDAFALAQQWAFLAALCFNYKDNCPQDATTYNFVQRVLAARNAASLVPILNQMLSAETLIAAGCQSSVFYQPAVQFSIRNNSFQANATQGSGTNTVITSYEPVLQGGLVLTNAAASLAAWSNYLASCIITNKFWQRVLVLNFSTSLNAQLVGGLQRNPLWSCEYFGTSLYSGLDNNGHQLHGVQVSFSTLGFNPQEGFVINLAQNGTSVVRSRGFGNTTLSTAGFRYFNFGYYSAGITALANDLSADNFGTAAFQDRSPANGQWQLTINESDSANNGVLINNLGQLTDIQLQFGIRSYVDQTAAQACSAH